MHAPSERLFHVLVVMAAANPLGCGQSKASQGTPGAVPQAGSAGSSGGMGAGNELGGGNSGGMAGAITGGEGGQQALPDCAHSEQIGCTAYVPTPTDCACDPTRPATEADCSGAFHFSCESYDPPLGCECVIYTGPK